MFGGDSFGGFDESGRLPEFHRAGRLVGVPSYASGRVAKLYAATEEDLGLGDPPDDHDQCGPSGVGAKA